MDLTARYLNSVRSWLPKSHRPATNPEDILAEIAEDLRSQMEDREASLGRPLNEAEVCDLLIARGHPRAVAQSYLPKRHLIGPEWFPAYRFTARLVMLWVLTPLFALIAAAAALLSPAHPGPAIAAAVWQFVHAMALAFGVITLVFACLDKYHAAYRNSCAWDPRRLPQVPPPGARTVSRCNAISEIVYYFAIALGWTWLVRIAPLVWDFSGVQVELAPVWRGLFWPVLALSLGGVAVGIVSLVRPWHLRTRTAGRLALDGVALALAWILMNSGPLAALTSTNLSAEGLQQAARWADLTIRWSVVSMAAMTVVFDLVEAWRNVIKTRPAGPPANGLIASPSS